MPDGKTLYVWFTPDVNQPIELQVVDGVTGIYVYHQENGSWIGPDRVYLQDQGKAALDVNLSLVILCGFVLPGRGILGCIGSPLILQMGTGTTGSWRILNLIIR